MTVDFNSSDRAILDLLLKHESMTVVQMASALEVTATAVRQRLNRLLAQKLIQRRQEGQGKGRPNHKYSLTTTGRRQAGEDLGEFAEALWEEVLSIEDRAIRQTVVRGIAKRLASKYMHRVKGTTIQEKIDSIAQVFSERRVPLSVVNNGGVPGLKILACPYPDFEDNESMICMMEQILISELLGRDVQLNSVTSIRDEAGRCCCTFEPTSPESKCGASIPEATHSEHNLKTTFSSETVQDSFKV